MADRPAADPSGAAADPGPLDLLIVGAGFAGMHMLHKARGLGLRALVVEAADDVGGTWWWNRYPGARCDIESLQYSYSWDPELQQDWTWTERYATQPEILAYAHHVADRHDLRRDIVFGRRVAALAWDDAAGRWTATLDDGRVLTAGKVVLATGCLSAARMPDIPGRDDFAGASLHTAAWPHEGADLSGLRVAVIGTGSSAIQAIPEIARAAAHVTVFQRTANFSVPAKNRPLEDEEIARWKADYPELRRRAREETRSGVLHEPPVGSARDADPEAREREYRRRWERGGTGFMNAFDDLLTDETANETAAEFVRARIREIVADPETAEALAPDTHPIFTKRICVDDDYFATFNRPNVTLVDLRRAPIDRIEPTGVRAGGALHEVDAIVFATGFDAMTGAIEAIDIRGRDGRTIRDKWSEGPRAWLGLALAGFPNLFTITGPGSPSVLSNVIVSIEQHVDLLGRLFADMAASGVDRAEPERDAEDAWVERVNAVAARTLMPRAASWYMGANIPGKPRVFMPFIGVAAYRKICEEIAADGWRGLRLSRGADAGSGAGNRTASAAAGG